MDGRQPGFVDTKDCSFACFMDGPADGPLALCLHGYPDTPHTWRNLAPALLRSGWRVVRPFLRGYAPTACSGSQTLNPGTLGRDANALHSVLGGDGRAVLIGHDWGAAAAYAASAAEPGRWASVVTAGWPPLPAAIDLASFEQMRRSWYVMLFQLTEGERLVCDAGFIRSLWRVWSPGYSGNDDADRAARSLTEARRGAAVIQLYRSLFDGSAGGAPLPMHPTLYLHGTEDGCIGVELVDGLERHLPFGSAVRRIEGAGHFPQLEKPDAFNAAVLGFLASQHRGG